MCGANAFGVIRLTLTLMAALGQLLFRSKLELMIEYLALRQQLAIFKHKQPHPSITRGDRLFWVFLRGSWPSSVKNLEFGEGQ